MSASLQRPIIVLGAGRSGTTAIAELLRHHPDVAVWEEPKHIWRFGHAYRSHDVLSARDATPRVKRYIREQFSEFLEASGRTRFAEKTPSNCFRVSFIREIFPDAVFLHVVRDGRAVSVSAMQQWKHDYVGSFDGEYTPNTSFQGSAADSNASRMSGLVNGWRTMLKFLREKNRLAGGPAVWVEAPAYVPDLTRVYLRKLSRAERSYVWGPKYPGIHEVHAARGLLDAVALQWLLCVKYVLADAPAIPPGQFMQTRYEDLVAEPARVLSQFAEFAGLGDPQPLIEAGARLLRPTTERWRSELTVDEVALLEGWLGPMMRDLGYTVTSGDDRRRLLIASEGP